MRYIIHTFKKKYTLTLSQRYDFIPSLDGAKLSLYQITSFHRSMVRSLEGPKCLETWSATKLNISDFYHRNTHRWAALLASHCTKYFQLYPIRYILIKYLQLIAIFKKHNIADLILKELLKSLKCILIKLKYSHHIKKRNMKIWSYKYLQLIAIFFFFQKKNWNSKHNIADYNLKELLNPLAHFSYFIN